MKLLQITAAVALIAWSLSSCTKTTNNNNGGLSYGITGIEPQFAGAGDTIDVYGVGFAASATGNMLTVNGVQATIVKATPEDLTIVVPTAPKQGNVQVKTGSQSFTYTGPFVLGAVVTGSQSKSVTWTANNLYIIKGKVEFQKGATLTVQPGTTILCDRDTLASLIIDDGASVSMNGTPQQPIVFTSIMPEKLRFPGDWGGIMLSASTAAGTDSISYVRIEYAGNHIPNLPGAALEIDRSEPAGNIHHVQTSYSGSDGFRSAGNGTIYLQYLVAFGDAGNDFSFLGAVRAFGQFFLGLKDPQFADQLGADGLLVQSTQPVTLSNISLVGYDGIGRNCITTSYYDYSVPDYAIDANAGRGIHVSGAGTLQLFNSMVAASWLAGISLDGPAAWNAYENGGTVVRQTSFTFPVSAGDPGYNKSLTIPYSGFAFSSENISGPYSGFERTENSAQYAAFTTYNDTTPLKLKVLSTGQPITDGLGIHNMADSLHLNAPLLTIQTGSPLLMGQDYGDARLADPFFDRTAAFRGAFGPADWTSGWASFAPELSPYE
ncbi:MAG TPA: IPT/TIG domain-containing protein [Dinghuibacter sp.]|uniref:IPT/TIG domain-containing protein n=1 Tax=Dinghuibacter sp. TaxID=2024697 RepID=UPI002C8240F9|nr:IPT/TIG domain-containing protein [Dinghuibacter sp.]HTJ14532.1 IPT/TIG domain-containing protein [Dinghuibacter sp.]